MPNRMPTVANRSRRLPQLPSEAAIRRFVVSTVKKALGAAHVVKVNTRDDVGGYDDYPLYCIDVVFDGDRMDSEKLYHMRLRVHDYFRDNQDERLPLFTFLRPEDEAEYYAPREFA